MRPYRKGLTLGERVFFRVTAWPGPGKLRKDKMEGRSNGLFRPDRPPGYDAFIAPVWLFSSRPVSGGPESASPWFRQQAEYRLG
jgi:hypothetical protein